MSTQQRGFTFIEILVVLAVGGVLLSGLVIGIFQTFNVTKRSSMQITALENVKAAAYQVSKDVQLAGGTAASNLSAGGAANSLNLVWITGWYDANGQLLYGNQVPTPVPTPTLVQNAAYSRSADLNGTRTGTFIVGETVTQTGSGATAVLLSQASKYIVVDQISGAFTSTGTVRGNTSNATLAPYAIRYNLVRTYGTYVPTNDPTNWGLHYPDWANNPNNIPSGNFAWTTPGTVARFISSVQFSRSDAGTIIVLTVTSSPENKPQTAMQEKYHWYLQPQVAPVR